MPKNEFGYGDVAARTDDAGLQSGGCARPELVETNDGKCSPGGQIDPVYHGGDNDNATGKGNDGDAQ